MKSRLNPMETAGVLMVLSLVAVAILAPWLAPYDPTRAVANTFGDPAAPSRMFPLGWHRITAARQRHSERSEESRSPNSASRRTSRPIDETVRMSRGAR